MLDILLCHLISNVIGLTNRLRMSQPALTRQMQVLEREMGGGLLDRTSFGVRPTDAGYELASRMKPILAG